MSHWAEVDSNNTVLRVLVGNNSDPNEGYDWLIENLGGTWIKTSYNGNIHYNFAGVGFTWDPDYNGTGAFIPPQPYPSWKLSNVDATWKAPVAYPTDGLMYDWDESITDWKATVNG